MKGGPFSRLFVRSRLNGDLTFVKIIGRTGLCLELKFQGDREGIKKKLMLHDFYLMKKESRKITGLTSYDFPTAQFAEAAGLDMLLAGDSLGMCVYGYPGTVPVTMDQCIMHCEAVRRGAPNTFVIGDMPFLSYQTCNEKAVENAGRFLKEANADAIELEGGVRVAPRIKASVEAGIVMAGHVGLTPQSSGVLGGHKAQGRTAKAAKLVVEIIIKAMSEYCEEVRSGAFPGYEHCYGMIEGEEHRFLELMQSGGAKL